MNVSLGQIKQLREATSLGIADCRRALEDSQGDIDKALALLKKRGIELAATKADRPARSGRIASYIHFDNKIGVLVEVNSETDFVARNEEFIKFSSDLALHIAATNPGYIKREDVPQDLAKEHTDIEAFYKEACLLEQPFVKDPSITIRDYLNSIAAKVGENIVLRRFARFKLGQ